MAEQLTLGITPGSDQNLETFVFAKSSALAAALNQLVHSPQSIYLWGDAGVGKTHLLQAACKLFAARNRSSGLLAGTSHAALSPELVSGWESLALVAIDDVQGFAGDRAWEESLFHLYNRVQETQGSLLISGSQPPANLSLQLADLKSRLGNMLIFQVAKLDDEQRLSALQAKAGFRGMELSREAGQWLLNRFPRDMHQLSSILDRLDRASLREQRRLTIPFLKEILETGQPD